jgi:hypothetical protein
MFEIDTMPALTGALLTAISPSHYYPPFIGANNSLTALIFLGLD